MNSIRSMSRSASAFTRFDAVVCLRKLALQTTDAVFGLGFDAGVGIGLQLGNGGFGLQPLPVD